MPNVTLAVGCRTVGGQRRYAAENNTSLNAMIRSLLERTVRPRQKKTWMDDLIMLADKAKGNSNGWKWNRDELYSDRC